MKPRGISSMSIAGSFNSHVAEDIRIYQGCQGWWEVEHVEPPEMFSGTTIFFLRRPAAFKHVHHPRDFSHSPLG
jgi:hypothetical protein